ncbi:EF-P beta-lysylation protein EpmB [Thiosocius teredinicola]|uniref:EF-P beta-lysylation protein EpmB n=1 Tax=Thiosocius teredinicola TaxID=1973002 RepID=UPI000990FB65
MITCSPSRLESAAWQRELAQAVTDPAELLRLIGLSPADRPDTQLLGNDFTLRVPRYFIELMRRGDPDDPLLLQVLPRVQETETSEGYVSDPVGDLDAAQQDGLLQKYARRALLVTTGACAVHCRYCFRRHFPYVDLTGRQQSQAAIDHLAQRPDIDEVILSGGDPLSLSDERFADIVSRLEGLAHVRRLRVHTRTPVVLPSRITAGLVGRLADSRLQTVIVLHINHPNEVSDTLAQALEPLRTAGIHLLNQSVLLKSINDDADTLAKLSDSLLGIGVMPYYLHLLDPVAGAAHFDVPLERAKSLLDALRERLPGYLVPRMVRELPGKPYKMPITRL